MSDPVDTASSSSRAERLLRFWHAVELFSPSTVRSPRESRASEPIVEWRPGKGLPWQAGVLPEPGRGREWLHYVYLGPFDLSLVSRSLKQWFGEDPIADERPGGLSSLAAFAVTQSGHCLPVSYTVGSLAWALGQMWSRPGEPEALEGFELALEDARQDFLERRVLAAGDAVGRELQENGIEAGALLDGESLEEELARIRDGLSWTDEAAAHLRPTFIRSLQVSKKRPRFLEDLDFLNSFLAADLRRVGAALRRGEEPGRALAAYLSRPTERSLEERVDVRAESGVAAVDRALAPRFFPGGRWPAPPEWQPSRSQQFAVNSVMAELGESAGLFAINGPPGTGKTTLLRDVIAAVVVRRADALCRLKRPERAFGEEVESWSASGYARTIRALDESLTGFEIVVASSNNAAVENISKEIPARGAVDAGLVEDFSDLEEIAAALLAPRSAERAELQQLLFPPQGEEGAAWALLSAVLGNKSNRSHFASVAWFGRLGFKRETGKPLLEIDALQKRLKQARGQPKADSWKEAVKSYRTARRRVEKLTGERQAAVDALERLPERRQALAALEAGRRRAEGRVGELEGRLGEAHREIERARDTLQARWHERTTIHEARPRTLESLLTWGGAYRSWSEEARGTRRRFAEARAVVEAAEGRQEELRRGLAEARAEIEETVATLATAQAELRQDEEKARSFGLPVEQGAGAEDETAGDSLDRAAEASVPLVDRPWNEARSRLFLAAIELHRAWLWGASAQAQRNLLGAVDLLSGQAPTQAPREAVRAAWQTLFLVTPVLSTTFASLDRLFQGLGKEDLGWLLVDEAGQTVPQAVVGGLWRSRRAVLVGDPQQLQPVVTLPSAAIDSLVERYRVDPEWRPDRTSAQQLADRHNRYGTTLELAEGDLWVGAPLRVHRRCDEPMFTVANRIAYDDLMIQGKLTADSGEPRPWPPSAWLDVRGTPDGHWIAAQGAAVLHELQRLPGVDAVACLAPFRRVAQGLNASLAKRFPGLHVGTIHTYQGKEAEVVFLVLGGDPERPGAIQWVSSSPNLLNVAITRARSSLIVVGDLDLWRREPHFAELAAELPVREGALGL